MNPTDQHSTLVFKTPLLSCLTGEMVWLQNDQATADSDEVSIPLSSHGVKVFCVLVLALMDSSQEKEKHPANVSFLKTKCNPRSENLLFDLIPHRR